jgi:hypothetical protein
MSTEVTYDADGYAETPQGQAWKLWVSGGEPATEADRGWFGTFNTDARQDERQARIEDEAERTDQENRGIPWTDSPDRPAGPYRNGPWRTWPFPGSQAEITDREPEAGNG